MPEIARFGSFKLLMFFQDENPPHVHIKGSDFAGKMRVSRTAIAGWRCAQQGPETGPPLGRRTSGRVIGDVD